MLSIHHLRLVLVLTLLIIMTGFGQSPSAQAQIPQPSQTFSDNQYYRLKVELISSLPYQPAGRMWPDTRFAIQFDQPMDPEQTEAAFKVIDFGWDYSSDASGPICPDGESLAGTFSWNDLHTRMLFTPADALIPNHVYVFVLTEAARTADQQPISDRPACNYGYVVGRPAETSYTTALRRWGGRLSFTRVRFNYSQPMDIDSFEDRVRVTPQPPGQVSIRLEEELTRLVVGFDRTAGVDYLVSVSPGVQDLMGVSANRSSSVIVNALPTPEQLLRTSVQLPNLLVVREGDIPPSFGVSTDMPGDVAITLFHFPAQLLQTLDFRWDDPWNPVGNDDTLYTAWDMLGPGALRKLPWRLPRYILRTWHEQFGNGDLTSIERLGRTVTISSEDGSALPRGLYGLEIASLGLAQPAGSIVAVVNANVMIKTTGGRGLVWVTDLVDGRPLANVRVSVSEGHGVSFSAMTDAQGLVAVPDRLMNEPTLIVTAESDGYLGIAVSGYNWPEFPHDQTLFTLDRPAYQVGETVHFRGLLRQDDHGKSTLARVSQANVSVNFHNGQSLTDIPIEISPFGTFSGSFVIPQAASSGAYITLNVCSDPGQPCPPSQIASAHFFIAQTGFGHLGNVMVEPSAVVVRPGQSFMMAVDLRDEAGISYPPENVQIHLPDHAANWEMINPALFDPNFNFTDEDRPYRPNYAPASNRQLSLTPVGLDDDGQLMLQGMIDSKANWPFVLNQEIDFWGAPGSNTSQLVQFRYEPSQVMVGIRADAAFGQIGLPFQLEALTVDGNGRPRAGQTVEFTISQLGHDTVYYYSDFADVGQQYSTERSQIIHQNSVITGENGLATVTFQPPEAGIYIVRARAQDGEGGVHTSTLRLYALGPSLEDNLSAWGSPFARTEDCYIGEYPLSRVITERDLYQPGEQARLLVYNPYSHAVSALVTVERGDVLWSQVLTLADPVNVISLPIEESYQPAVDVRVMLLSGREKDTPPMAFITGGARLNIEPDFRQLQVEIISSGVFTAGQPAVFEVNVTDSDGRPVEAEVALSLVDERVYLPGTYTLLDNDSWEQDWAYRHNLTDTLMNPDFERQIRNSLTLSLFEDGRHNVLPYSCSAPSGGGRSPGYVALWPDEPITPFWDSVVTGPDGRASVTIDLPQQPGTWRFDAHAITRDTRVGQAQVIVETANP